MEILCITMTLYFNLYKATPLPCTAHQSLPIPPPPWVCGLCYYYL